MNPGRRQLFFIDNANLAGETECLLENNGTNMYLAAPDVLAGMLAWQPINPSRNVGQHNRGFEHDAYGTLRAFSCFIYYPRN
jgi:hypothetical protein